ncbi:hypothetical protein RHECIAT_CH0001353 [Rhizobium etli CIAT 652]|uniref:Uncharacterized protein n=1 Tax=Rhizobium etli (strain CIAT 652) TaxID=491916 RepID=B3PU30_RHIE6|nr:hypothetical protein RHECIAT_CH0001353 [Rhizobium etli CIAT 652]
MLLIVSRQQKSVCFRRAAATVFDRCCDRRDSSPCCRRAGPAAALRGCHHRSDAGRASAADGVFRLSLLICRQAPQHRDIRVAGQERRIIGRSCCPSLALEPGKICGSAMAANALRWKRFDPILGRDATDVGLPHICNTCAAVGARVVAA